jgi:hypothetical protein
MAGLIRICEKNAMALVLQVRKKKRDFLGSFQSGANGLLVRAIVPPRLIGKFIGKAPVARLRSAKGDLGLVRK